MSCNNTCDLEQLPGMVNIKMVDDNDFVFAIDWDIDITGYSWAAYIIPDNGDPEIPLGTEVINASDGTMNVIISSSSIADISPSINNWYLDWTTPAPDNYVRTVLNGKIRLFSKAR